MRGMGKGSVEVVAPAAIEWAGWGVWKGGGVLGWIRGEGVLFAVCIFSLGLLRLHSDGAILLCFGSGT